MYSLLSHTARCPCCIIGTKIAFRWRRRPERRREPYGRRQDDYEITTVERGAAMRQAVLQTNGLVELIAPDPRLAAHEGVGVLLHYQ